MESILQFAMVVREANKFTFQPEPRLYKSHHYEISENVNSRQFIGFQTAVVIGFLENHSE
jgi:hypothetical protein